MLKVYDRTEIIKLIQKYLNKTKQNEDFIVPSGIYDQETVGAVRAFQQRNNIDPSGTVDMKTLERLYENYLDIIKMESLNPQIELPLYRGDYNETVLTMNKYLRMLLNSYKIPNNLYENSYFSSETESAVRFFRKKYGMEDLGFIDYKLYSMIMRDLNSL